MLRQALERRRGAHENLLVSGGPAEEASKSRAGRGVRRAAETEWGEALGRTAAVDTSTTPHHTSTVRTEDDSSTRASDTGWSPRIRPTFWRSAATSGYAWLAAARPEAPRGYGGTGAARPSAAVAPASIPVAGSAAAGAPPVAARVASSSLACAASTGWKDGFRLSAS
jgi:hypothetical protein